MTDWSTLTRSTEEEFQAFRQMLNRLGPVTPAQMLTGIFSGEPGRVISYRRIACAYCGTVQETPQRCVSCGAPPTLR